MEEKTTPLTVKSGTKLKVDLRITGTIEAVNYALPEQPKPEQQPKPEPQPKDPDTGKTTKLIESDSKTFNEIADEVETIARQDSLVTQVVLNDGFISGDLTKVLKLPIGAANHRGVQCKWPVSIRSIGNEINGLVFLADNLGGLRIEAPGNRIHDSLLVFGSAATHQVGVAVHGSAYDATLKTVINGATVDDWGRTKEEVVIRVGKSNDLPDANQDQRFVEIKECVIKNGARSGENNYSVPIQSFWPAWIGNNRIEDWNGEGIQIKASHCRILDNLLSRNHSKGRGALYDRGTNPHAKDNEWRYNFVSDCVWPFDIYGALQGVIQDNVITRYARPGRFQCKYPVEDWLIQNNTFYNQQRILGVTMQGWSWGNNDQYPKANAIKFKRNLYKNHAAKLVEDHSEVSGHWTAHGDVVYNGGEDIIDPLPKADEGDYTVDSEYSNLGARWP